MWVSGSIEKKQLTIKNLSVFNKLFSFPFRVNTKISHFTGKLFFLSVCPKVKVNDNSNWTLYLMCKLQVIAKVFPSQYNFSQHNFMPHRVHLEVGNEADVRSEAQNLREDNSVHKEFYRSLNRPSVL